tara:strand:- start:306 stop:980 length:675 start_codon:yes stop_codon:yes gene_type:complete
MIQKYVGIDGSRSGWIVSTVFNNTIDISWVKSLRDINYKDVKVALIDMPLQLPRSLTDYPRNTDMKAKKILKKRHSCIFYAPLEKWLDQDYVVINEECEKNNKPKCSKQSYNLFSKINELRMYIIEKKRLNIKEHHPELVFRFFNNNTPLISKYSKEGLQEREDIIQKILKISFVNNLKYLKSSHKLGFSKIDQVDSVILSLFARYTDLNKSIENNQLLHLFED